MGRLAPEDWVVAAMRVMASRGVEAVKVEVLARELGVSKGSFYHHFSKRAELLGALLTRWESEGTEGVIRAVESETDDPDGRLRTLMKSVFGTELEYDIFESQLRAWARHDSRARDAVARVDTRRIGYVADLLVAAGQSRAQARARARILYRTLVGDFIIRSHGGKPLQASELKALYELLTSP